MPETMNQNIRFPGFKLVKIYRIYPPLALQQVQHIIYNTADYCAINLSSVGQSQWYFWYKVVNKPAIRLETIRGRSIISNILSSI